ncbi:hypothetical protein [Pseudoduganella sp. GCM10020061]|uniref:hypothetical protein n=1 Tax=Pseudoduganella sp. GCM10020061 TaxID=3317345 RepID=UPI00362B8A87
MENAAQRPNGLGFTIGIVLLAAVAVTLVANGAPAPALSAWIILSEITYLIWAAWGESPHRGDAAAFAVKMNVQAGIRVMFLLVLAMMGLLATSLLPGVSAADIIGALDPNGDLAGGGVVLIKLAIAASIALAAVRLQRARQRGMSFRSLADGSYCKHSVRIQGTLTEVSDALDERLAFLALPDAPRFGGLLLASRVRVLRTEEDGRPIARLYFSNFPVRATISLRQIDQRHTDLRVWFRVRGGYLLSELFPNPLNVTALQEFLDDAVVEPIKNRQEQLAPLPGSPRPTSDMHIPAAA